jgi:DNA-binding LytR/AlgR family response regulator
MKVLLIEDERHAAIKLKQMLKKIDETIFIVNTLETVKETVQWFQKNETPDLVLMDIQLNDGICFEIFSQVQIQTPVIFTTAYDEYAIRAFKVNSIDYLLKPIDIDLLKSAIEKFKTIYQQKPVNNIKINQIYTELSKNYRNRFLVKIGTQFTSVPADDIECFYIKERCTFLKTISGKNYDLDYSLEQIENLINPELFFRINRNYIINIKSITNILAYSTNRLKLKLTHDNYIDELIVSRDKVTEFKQWLDK